MQDRKKIDEKMQNRKEIEESLEFGTPTSNFKLILWFENLEPIDNFSFGNKQGIIIMP